MLASIGLMPLSLQFMPKFSFEGVSDKHCQRVILKMCAAAAIPIATAAAGSNPVGWAIAGCAAVAAVALAANGSKKRSSDPIALRNRSATRKEAYEKAKRAGGGREPRGPEDHNDGNGPHFHPDVTDRHKHDHYYFPKRWGPILPKRKG